MNTYRVILRDRPAPLVIESDTIDYIADDGEHAYWFGGASGLRAVVPGREVIAITVELDPFADAATTGEAGSVGRVAPGIDEFDNPSCECDGCTEGASVVTVEINGSPVLIDERFAARLINDYLNGASR